MDTLVGTFLGVLIGYLVGSGGVRAGLGEIKNTQAALERISHSELFKATRAGLIPILAAVLKKMVIILTGKGSRD